MFTSTDSFFKLVRVSEQIDACTESMSKSDKPLHVSVTFTCACPREIRLKRVHRERTHLRDGSGGRAGSDVAQEESFSTPASIELLGE